MYKHIQVCFVFVLILNINQRVNCERHEVKLDEKFVFGWEVNEKDGNIEIDAIGENLGYIGIGLSIKGKMDDAEMAIGGVEDKSSRIYYGIYTGHKHKVKLNPKKKQWKLLEAKQNDTHTFVKYSRPLAYSKKSCCSSPFTTILIPIKDKEINVIWALGDSDQLKKHHGHGKYKVNLIHPSDPRLTNQKDGFFLD